MTDDIERARELALKIREGDYENDDLQEAATYLENIVLDDNRLDWAVAGIASAIAIPVMMVVIYFILTLAAAIGGAWKALVG
jgi:hypothetical protein